MQVVLGTAVASAIVFLFGQLLIEVSVRRLEGDPIVARAAAALCGVVLCGFWVMVPARLAPSEAAFSLAIQWFVPLTILLMSAVLVLRGRRPRLPRLRIRRSWVMRVPEWASALALLAITVAVVIHPPDPPATIELAGTRQVNMVRVDARFDRVAPAAYVLTASAQGWAEPVSYAFTSPGSGVLSIEFPVQSGLTVELKTAAGEVLRSLNWQ